MFLNFLQKIQKNILHDISEENKINLEYIKSIKSEDYNTLDFLNIPNLTIETSCLLIKNDYFYISFDKLSSIVSFIIINENSEYINKLSIFEQEIYSITTGIEILINLEIFDKNTTTDYDLEIYSSSYNDMFSYSISDSDKFIISTIMNNLNLNELEFKNFILITLDLDINKNLFLNNIYNFFKYCNDTGKNNILSQSLKI